MAVGAADAPAQPGHAPGGRRDGGGDAGRGAFAFRACAVLALALHAVLLLSPSGVQGGADLVPHLRLIQQMGEAPALRTVYAPAYHALGALVSPAIGLASFPKAFAFASALALILGFRFFQRGAGLPDASAALFALSPYVFLASWCIPKIEFAGHALGLLGLGLVIRRRHLGVALVTAAVLAVHTAAALVFGLAAGVLCLAARDPRGLAALAVGTLAALPLFGAHVAAGCSVAQAFLFSPSGYLGQIRPALIPPDLPMLLALASPLALAAAALGARPLWRTHRAVAWMCLALLLLYLNSFLLAPFGIRTALGLQRGLSVLAIPVAIAAGVGLRERGRLRTATLCACALYAVLGALVLAPRSCFVRPIALSELRGLEVRRCSFSWSGPELRERRRLMRPQRRAPRARPAPDTGARGATPP